MSPRLVVCPVCAAEVASNAPRCPQCGTPWPGGRLAPVYEGPAYEEPRRRPERKPLGCFARTALIIAGFIALGQIGLCLNPPAPPTPEQAARDSVRAATGDSLAARRAAGFPNESSLRIAAEYALKDVAADRDAVDVRQCGVVGDLPEAPPSYTEPWRVRCTFGGRNAFGGMVIQSAVLDYYETGNARVVAVE